MSRPGLNNELRIIGGRWRGRRLRFPPLPGIRPTPDRVRETVFNWLQQPIVGSRCLDLFAGSGALGLEALSRGAAHVTFVDTERAVAEHLHQTLKLLDAEAGATIKVQDARKFLKAQGPVPASQGQDKGKGAPAAEGESKSAGGTAAPAFDIVFLDPPFAMTGLADICRSLDLLGVLASPALIYLEMPARAGGPELPQGWTLLKSKQAGEVGYHLARRENPTPQPPRESQ